MFFSETYLLRPNVLELKTRARRQGKCFGAAREVLEAEHLFRTKMEVEEQPHEYNYIHNDIWFHIANYIPPQDVKRYALICTQSACSIRSRRFWLNLYRQYCQHSKDKKKWILELPAHLQMSQLLGCDVHTLKQRVVRALFYCHTPFTESLKNDYKLETLVGRYYVSCWHLQTECVWIMCYKFRWKFPLDTANAESPSKTTNDDNEGGEEVVYNWESLAGDNSSSPESEASSNENSSNAQQNAQNDDDGVSLLLICCNRFIPFPTEYLYANSTSAIRLAATREHISTDMRSINLHIDLVTTGGNQEVVTWKYNQALKTKVLPWWHPDFGKFNKCE